MIVRERRKTRTVFFNNLPVGGDNPIVIESMTNTKAEDIISTLKQIESLTQAGCELIRVAVPDLDAASALPEIVDKSPIPVVADIHFDSELAKKAALAGVAGLRFNPGNMKNKKAIYSFLDIASKTGIPVRIGVNLGSLQSDLNKMKDKALAMFESASRYVEVLEEYGYEQMLVSMKASDVDTTVRANRLFSERYDYPLHIGITEAGPLLEGTVHSSIGIGLMLTEGIGDTIRVSLTADPVEEVRVGREILSALGLRPKYRIISCPTCGRTNVPVIEVAEILQKALLKELNIPAIDIAVMGCAVNGPGEAKHADLGIAGSKTGWVFFKKGKTIKHIKGFTSYQIVEFLINEIKGL